MDGVNKNVLCILDDVFPHPHSINSWRGTEFFSYLDNFSNSLIITSLSSIGLLGKESKRKILNEFHQNHTQYSKRLIYDPKNIEYYLKNAGMAYLIFLNNIWTHLNILEKHEIPFIFELYPGGGFALGNIESDQKLRRVMESRCFKGVIVSNIVTYRYLLEGKYCQAQKVCFIPGCVLNNNSWEKDITTKKYFGYDKDTFDIAFAAYRYSDFGVDKGYDVFIQVIKTLHELSKKFRFHVVGNFDESIIDVNELKGYIEFYGVKETDWFNNFYKGVDVFVSPNRSSILNKGAFDGFPTGCCIEALVRKTVLIATDEMNQNNGQYENGKDIFIVNENPQIIVDRILFLFRYPYILRDMSENGCYRARDLYSYNRQIKTRINYLSKNLEQCVDIDRKEQFEENE